jgi:aspartyl-tRNA(Asn)/glutamyl-tRNA(Gln) amidotransferase subunit A
LRFAKRLSIVSPKPAAEIHQRFPNVVENLAEKIPTGLRLSPDKPGDSSTTMRADSDLSTTRELMAVGKTSARAQIEMSLAAASQPGARFSFLSIDEPGARACAHAVDSLHAAGAPLPALAGLAIGVKDLFDIAGQRTCAGSIALDDTAPAAVDAPAVARLRRAGAALVGRNNMTEFAFSGVGINPHFGTPANVPMASIDPNQPRIPGGSSSGAASCVAAGAAWAALGSDTGGSIRIPAALQGLVGFKSTASRVPTEGSIPLSTTLDTACAITRSVRDAVLLHEVLADRRVRLHRRAPSSLRLLVLQTTFLDGLDADVAADFERSIATLVHAGARIESHELECVRSVSQLQANGGFSAAESYAWHRALLARRGDSYDPRVALRIRRGESMSAADYLDLHRARRAWIDQMHAATDGFDAIVSPTVPIVAPALAPLVHDDDAFFKTNAALLRNPSVINLFDGCAISLPCHRHGATPTGLMLWSRADDDDALLSVALTVEAALAPRRA